MMKLNSGVTSSFLALMVATSLGLASAILVQPNNYMLDDSALIGNQPDGGSLSPFYNDQSGASEHGADKDIVSIIGDKLARLRFARMLESQDEAAAVQSQFSQEMADLIQSEQQQANAKEATGQQEQSLSSSVANMLLNVAAQAAASDVQPEQQDQAGDSQTGSEPKVSSRGSIVEMDTSQSAPSSASMPSKADLKSGPSQWFNPKETIPILKISSMATPSKYKKVYFRSEKKLVDGAFHSLPSVEQEEKKSLLKSPFSSGVQRRSSRGTGSSSAPPSPLQDGVIEFLKKFRDVYIQTRPVSSNAGGQSAASQFASQIMQSAASSPFASVLAPPSSGSRPNLASALQAATSMVAQATSSSSSQSSSSASTGSAAQGAANSPATVTTSQSSSAPSSPNKSPISAQSYVSFWSKTFPTWVRRMLKQLRRRSLYNSSRRQQHQHQHSATGANSIGQAAASSAVASVVEQATSGSSSGSGGSSTNNNNSNSAR